MERPEGRPISGRRDLLTRGNGASTDYGYDAASRLTSLVHDLAGTADDQNFGFAYTPASQLSQRTAANDNYNWPAANITRAYTRNGLNQYTTISGTAQTHDARGNLTNDGSRTLVYDLENRLTSVSGGATATLSYDPLGRLRSYVAGGTTTEFLYDGDRLVGEYVAGALTRRYVHGPGVDEPLVQYTGSGTTNRAYLITDHQGSIVAENGATTTRYSYGPYGEPNVWTGQRFRYTGQIALPEIGLYHYKARAYCPECGRFLQTDPLGYVDGMNLYAYVRNDPMNMFDPTGLSGCADMANQGVSGVCFDAANFEENNADADLNLVSTSEADAAVATAGPSYAEAETENGFRVDGSTVTPAGTPGTRNGGDISTVSFSRSELEGADAFGHSHAEDVRASEIGNDPGTDGANPGSGDGKATLEAGMPNYITHQGRTIVIEVSGGQARVRVVAGTLNRVERRITRERLRAMQESIQRARRGSTP